MIRKHKKAMATTMNKIYLLENIDIFVINLILLSLN